MDTKIPPQTIYSQFVTTYIIPYYILDWQAELIQRLENLDAELWRLHLIEGSLLRALNQDWEEREHDLLFSCLDRIRQRMTEIQWELEKGLWAPNGYGDGYDE